MTGAADSPETTDEVGRRRSRPRDLVARALLTLALVGLVVWLLLSNVGELSDVVEALEGVSLADAVLLVALLLLSQVLIGAQLAATVPGLGLVRGMVAVESASAASNVVPGALRDRDAPGGAEVVGLLHRRLRAELGLHQQPHQLHRARHAGDRGRAGRDRQRRAGRGPRAGRPAAWSSAPSRSGSW
jgi:hypothetical protein